jgi:hypothetical protein
VVVRIFVQGINSLSPPVGLIFVDSSVRFRLWIMVTTANYPDVMMPSYNANRWTAVYFVSFMIISFFFLMNVILASVVSEYDAAVESRQKEYKDMAHKNLKQAFGFLDSENTGRIDRDTVMALFLLLNEDFPEFRSLSEEDTKLLFAVLDKDGSSTITEDEFMDFGNVLLLEFVKTSDYASVIETHFPKIYSAQWYKSFAAMIKSENFELFIDALLVANAIVIAIQTYPELSGTQTVHIDPKYWDVSTNDSRRCSYLLKLLTRQPHSGSHQRLPSYVPYCSTGIHRHCLGTRRDWFHSHLFTGSRCEDCSDRVEAL